MSRPERTNEPVLKGIVTRARPVTRSLAGWMGDQVHGLSQLPVLLIVATVK